MKFHRLIYSFILIGSLLFARDKDGTTFKNPAGTMTAGMDTVYVDVGNLGAHITNFGVFGLPGAGMSYEWPLGSGRLHLYRGGLAFGTMYKGAPRVSAFGASGFEWGSIFQEDSIHVITGETAVSDMDTKCIFSDTTPENTVPLEIQVKQNTFAYSEFPFGNFLIYDMTFINNSDNYYPQSFIGLIFDVDISSNGPIGDSGYNSFWRDDLVGYDPELKLSYMYDSESTGIPGPDIGGFNGEENGYFGIATLHSTENTLGNTDTLFQHLWYYVGTGPGNDDNYYNQWLNKAFTYPSPFRPDDYRVMQTYGPWDMQPGDSIHLSFAIALGAELNGLQNNTKRARQIFNNSYRVPDQPKPFAPHNLQLINAYQNPGLQWQPSGETGVSHFNVYDNGVLLASIPGVQSTFNLPLDYSEGEEHHFKVSAVWANDTESSTSNSVKWVAGTPTPVLGIRGKSFRHAISISWKHNTEPDIAEYNIYRNGLSISTVPDSIFYDIDIIPEHRYTYSVTALDTAGLESDTSFSVTITASGQERSRVLMIDDYGSSDPERKLIFETYLLSGYDYDYWNTFEQGEPNERSLFEYSAVLWFCGKHSGEPDYLTQFTEHESAALRRYLGSGGHLWLSGSHFLDYINEQDTLTAGSFAFDFLKIVQSGMTSVHDIYSTESDLPYLQPDISRYPWVWAPGTWVNFGPDMEFFTKPFYMTGYFTGPYQLKTPVACIIEDQNYKAAFTGFPMEMFEGYGIQAISRRVLSDFFGESVNTDLIIPTPVALSIAGWTAHNISLHWKSIEHPDLLGYHVYYSEQAGGPYIKYTDQPVKTDSITVAGLTEGKRYFFKITSVNLYLQESAQSEFCSELAGRPYQAEDYEWNEVSTDGMAMLSWKSNNESDFDHYAVYVDSVLAKQQTDTTFQIDVYETSKQIFVTCVDHLGLESYPTDTLLVRYYPATKSLLVVNGIIYPTYSGEMEDFYRSGASHGSYLTDIWDLFPFQGVNYHFLNIRIQGQYLDGGAIPDSFLFRYDKVVWIGNAYQGDEKFFKPDQIREYMLQHGNLLLITRNVEKFIKGNLQSYCGISSFTDSYNVYAGESYESLDSNLQNLPTRTYRSMGDIEFVRLDTLAPVTKLFQYHTYNGKTPTAGFRLQHPGHGEFIYIAGRAYRFNLDSLFYNVDYMLTNWMGGVFVNSTNENSVILPHTFSVHQNYPNPFNPSTTIRFSVPKIEQVQLKIFDVLGREVYQLKQKYEAGWHEIIWDGLNRNGNQSASGVYFYSLSDGQRTINKKCLLLR